MEDEIDQEVFRRIGNEITGRRQREGLAKCTEKRRFHAFFGTTPFICSLLWALIQPRTCMPRGYEPKHLMWALLFLKVYATEPVHRRLAGCPDEKTFRKWAWYFIHGIARLENIVVSKGLQSCSYPVCCFVLVFLHCFALRRRRLTIVSFPASFFFTRSFGTIGFEELLRISMSLSLLMEPTFASNKSYRSGKAGTATSSTVLASGMRSVCASELAILFGLMVPFLVVDSLI